MEFVYVVKRSELFDLHFPQGFLDAATHRDEVDRYLERARTRGFFVERRHAETDSTLKQIIPYVVIARGDEVLLLQRSKKGGDARLHLKLSIGVGGHVNPQDAGDGGDGGTGHDLLAAATRREIDEELLIGDGGGVDAVPIGFINDDSNPVGSVHVGIACLARIGRSEVRVRETELLSARFVSLAELGRIAGDSSADLETWSRFLVPALARRLAETRS